MPLFALRCAAGHDAEAFEHARDDFGCRTYLCGCGETMAPTLSVGRGLMYFEEGRGRWIHNLGHEPVYITSHAQHQRIMKERGLEWHPQKRGLPGCW